MSSGRKRRKSQSNQDGSEDIAETLAKWKEYNNKLDSLDEEGKPARKLHPKGSKKGCVKGKGGPDNSHSNYRGVRQRTWGKWVAEIRQPNGGPRLWLGTFGNALQAAQAYDEAAKAIYGPAARLNIPDSSFLKESFEASSSLQLQTTSCSYSTTTSTYSEDSKASNIDGEGESRIDDSKEDTVHMNEGIGLNAEQYYSSDEMFVVDELLGILDSTPHGFGQLELSDYAEIPQFEKPPDILLNQLQNPDAKLLESLQYWEQAPLEVDIGLDFLRPGRQEDCGHTLDELGFLNFDPDFGDLM